MWRRVRVVDSAAERRRRLYYLAWLLVGALALGFGVILARLASRG